RRFPLGRRPRRTLSCRDSRSLKSEPKDKDRRRTSRQGWHAMPAPDLISLFAQLGRPRVLVLGDLILDRYTWGNAERVSQEAPVIVLRADGREARLGGAANVANMLRGLEAQVTCCGVTGHDEAGAELRSLLEQAGACCDLVLAEQKRP